MKKIMRANNTFHKSAEIFILLFFAIFFFSNVIHSQTIQEDGGPFIYNSIASAYNSIASPISSPHVIEIKSGYTGITETFPVILSQKSESSLTNTITIRPDSGETVTLTGNGANALFSLDGADYIIFDGMSGGSGTAINLTVKNPNTGSNGIFEFKIAATNNTIRYIDCYIPGASGSSGGNNIFITQSSPGTGGNNDNSILNCII